MKRLLITTVLALFALALPGTANAQAKKAPPKTAKPAETAPAPAAPAADAKPAADAAAPPADAKTAPEKPKADAKKNVKIGSAGKVTALDADKKTITIGKVTYMTNDETQYINKEAPAQMTDVTVGINVGYSYTTDKAGKRTLAKVNVGVKQDAAKAAKGDKAADDTKPADTAKPKTGKKK